MKVLPREEATTVDRPERGPYVWPEIVGLMTSDSYKVWPSLGLIAANGDPLQDAYAVNFLETLYDKGYAVVNLEDDADAPAR